MANVIVQESSAVTDPVTMLAGTQNITGPFDSTACTDAVSFNIPETNNYTNYLTLKANHVALGLLKDAAKTQITTDTATYLTNVSTYAGDETATNNATVVSSLATVNADIAAYNVALQNWINAGTAMEVAIGLMGFGV